MEMRGWESGLPPTGGGHDGSGTGVDKDIYPHISECSRAMYTNLEVFDLCLGTERTPVLRVLKG